MKAISIRQPWAWAVFHGKSIENRTQAWKYRGPLAIHAGKVWSRTGQRSPLVRAAMQAAHPEFVLAHSWPVPSADPLITAGAIIGVVDLVDVHHAEPDAACCESPWAESRYRDANTGQEIGSVVHLVHINPRPFAHPIECAGRLGLWTPDDDVLLELEHRLCRITS